MENNRYSDDEIVNGLLGTPKERDEALKMLFLNEKLRGYIIGFVRKNKGNTQDGEDIFQDAIILLDRRVRQGGFKGSGSIGGYLQGIAKFLWYRKRAQWDSKTEAFELEQHEDLSENYSDLTFIQRDRKLAIEAILKKIGEKCKRILTMYKEQYSMEEIAEIMEFASKDVAKNEAYRCRQKFRNFVTKHPNYKELLGR